MKKLLIFAAAIFALLSTSCEPDNNGSSLKIMGSSTQDGIIEFIVTASSPNVTYICGLLPQDVFVAIGGESGLAAFVNTQLANNPEVHSGPYSFKFAAEPLAYYYYYAAEVKSGKMVGAPVLSEGVRFSLPYTRIVPKSPMVAFSISDNGVYVVGNSDNNSFIYNRISDEITYVEGANLYDISDEGIAVGTNNDSFSPVTYDINGDGTVRPVSIPEEYGDASLHGITADGSKMFGYVMLPATQDNPMPSRPMVIENGVFRLLSIEGEIYEHTTANCGSVSQNGVASNGMSVGYVITNEPWTYAGVLWMPDGTMKPMGHGIAKFEESDINYLFRGMFTRISPEGKYVSSEVEDYTESYMGSVSVYLYDTETEETVIAPAEDFAQMPMMSVSSVSDGGHVYISDTDMGLSENPPYVWTKDSATTLLEYYIKETYDVDLTGTLFGNVAASTDKGRTIVVTGYTDEGGGVFTEIYSF